MKKAAYIFFALLLSFASVISSFPVFGADDRNAVRTLPLDILKDELWEADEGVADISERGAAGKTLLSVSAEEDAGSIAFFAELDRLDLSEYSELIISLSVRGDSTVYPVTVTLRSRDSEAVHKTRSSEDSPVLYIPLEEEIRADLREIHLQIDCPDGNISYANLLSVSADDNHTYAYLDAFSATGIDSPEDIERESDGVSVRAKDSACSATVRFVKAESLDKDHDVLVTLKVATPVQGTVSLSCLYENEISPEDTASEEVEKTYTVDTPPRSASSGNTYFFVVPGGFKEATFRFGSLAENYTVYLTGAALHDMGKRETAVGSISSCSYSEGKINVLGSISNEASIEYYGSKLLLFAIPIKDALSYDLESYKPIASGSFSTKFSLSCPMNANYQEFLYKAVLDTDEGYISICAPCFADSAASPMPASSAVSALHGADAADVFETNVSSVILDVYAGKLLDISDIYSAQLYNYKKAYYFNREYLSELDNSLRFYASCGIKVYLRVYSDKEGYAFDYSPDDPDSLSLMCAVSSFLSERYPGASGFIMGTPLNGEVGADTPEYAEKKARIISVFCECIKKNIPTATVYIPYSESTRADAVPLCAKIHYYLAKYGAGSTVTLYETTSASDTAVSEAAYISGLSSVFASSSDGLALQWNVPSETETSILTKTYSELCSKAATVGMRFASLSVSKTDKSLSLFTALKEMLDGDNVISASISRFAATDKEVSHKSTYDFWDFTSSYETEGWVSGGSFLMPITAKGQNKKRVLKAESSPSFDGAGVLIGKTYTTVDLSGTVARVTLMITSPESESADVSLLFGSGESRAEFSARVECNKEVVLYCDMSAYPGAKKTEYTALIVRGAKGAEAELSKVELLSDTLSADELTEKYAVPENDRHDPLLYAAIIFVAAATVAIFSALLKKQKSNRKGDTK